MPTTPPPQPDLHKLKAALAQIDYILPGTINTVMNRCGKPSCACHHDPPRLHGPYITWTRKIKGKTVTRRLTHEQLERYQPWFENNRRLRELITELETLSLHAAEQAEGWKPQQPRTHAQTTTTPDTHGQAARPATPKTRAARGQPPLNL